MIYNKEIIQQNFIKHHPKFFPREIPKQKRVRFCPCKNEINHSSTRKYCSDQCKELYKKRKKLKEIKQKECLCGRLFSLNYPLIKGTSTKYCSDECTKIYYIDYLKPEKIQTNDNCYCGKLFIKKNLQHIYCSDQCRNNYSQANSWLKLRFHTLGKYKFTCQYCGRKAPEVKLHVDHIKPVSKYINLKFDKENLTVACKDCNLGKSNIDVCLSYHLNGG